MSRTVFVHPGLPKSGTSYLQRLMLANKAGLAEQGLLFPGGEWLDQVRAIQDLRAMKVAPSRAHGVAGAWGRLVAEIRDWPGDAVVSMEWLGPASRAEIRRLVRDLAPAQVQVVFTARDLGRTVPAAWQEFVQNRDEWTWSQFLDGVVAADRSASVPGRRFWTQQDLAGLLGTWSAEVPVERVHLVTLPHPGAPRDELWRRFCAVVGEQYLGLDPGSGGGANTSLGMESAELMRRLNAHAKERRISAALYHRALKHRLAKTVLAAHARQETTLHLPPAHHAWARQAAEEQIAAVTRLGVPVVGDLEELRPVLDDREQARQPEEVPAEELLDLLLGAVVESARVWQSAQDEETRRLRQRIRALEQGRRRPGAARRSGPVGGSAGGSPSGAATATPGAGARAALEDRLRRIPVARAAVRRVRSVTRRRATR